MKKIITISIIGAMIVFSGGIILGDDFRKIGNKPTIADDNAIFKKLPVTISKIVDNSGLAAANVTNAHAFFLVAMGDGVGEVDYAKGGISSVYSTGPGLTGSAGASVTGSVKIDKLQGKAAIWLNIVRDDNVPMLAIPEKLEVSGPGVYNLATKVKIPMEPNHKYTAVCYIDVFPTTVSSVAAVCGNIINLNWVF